MAGVERGRGRGNLGARESACGTREGERKGTAFLSFPPRAPKFPLPLPLSTPATQARLPGESIYRET